MAARVGSVLINANWRHVIHKNNPNLQLLAYISQTLLLANVGTDGTYVWVEQLE